MSFPLDYHISQEEIYRKYVEEALTFCQENFLSLETGWIHASNICHSFSHIFSQQCALEDNILFCLLLLRTKSQENIIKAKEHLEKTLIYQNSDGSFPVQVTELSTCRDWMSSFRILLALSMICCDFEAIFSKNSFEKVLNTVKKLYIWAENTAENNKESHMYCVFDAILAASSIVISKYNKAVNGKAINEYPFSSSQSLCWLPHFISLSQRLDLHQIGIVICALASLYKTDDRCFSVTKIKTQIEQAISHIANMWSYEFGFCGVIFSPLPQLKKRQAISLFHIGSSLLFEKKIQERVEKWPYEAIFSIALTYSCSVVDTLKLQQKADKNSFSNSLFHIVKPSIAVTHVDPSHQKKLKGFSPVRVMCASSWSSVIYAPNYIVEKKYPISQSADIKNQLELLFTKEEENLKPKEETVHTHKKDEAICQIFIEYIEDVSCFALHPDTLEYTAATFFQLVQPIYIGSKKNIKESVKITVLPCLEGSCNSDMWYASVRMANRPGQIATYSSTTAKRYQLTFPQVYDWIISIHCSQEKSAYSFSLILS